ncbi:MAG: hypothetical protein CME30_00090 [Gemmatimonadetes bacterium]|nr:hypothetical protein [Gemmatimonadota bacterium]
MQGKHFAVGGRDKKRLLMVADVAYPFVKGGAQRRQFEVGRRLVQAGWEVHLLSYQSWEGDQTRNEHGLKYIGMGPAPKFYNKKGRRSKIQPIHFFLVIMKNLWRVKHYDVIWASQWPMSHLLPISLTCHYKGISLVIDWFEVWGDLWVKYSKSVGWIGLVLEKILLRYTTYVAELITDSRVEQERIRRVSRKEKGIYFLPNGIPKDEIGGLPKVDSWRFEIVCLGRLKNHKGVDLLLRAIATLRDKHHWRSSLAVIGDGPERENLIVLSKRLGISDQVTFFGLIPDNREVYAIMKECCLCVVPTIGGGAGNVTLNEAYGCGLPVLGFQTPDGMDPDLIDHGNTGLWIQPVTPEALADGLFSILSNEKKLEKMRDSVVKKAEEFDWNLIARDYERIMLREY